VTAAICLTFAGSAHAQPAEEGDEAPSAGEDEGDQPEGESTEGGETEATDDTDTEEASEANDADDPAEYDTEEEDAAEDDGGEDATSDDSGSSDDDGGSLFASALSGGDTTETDDGGGGVPRTFSLNGYARSDVFVGKVAEYDRSEIKAAYGELALKLDIHKQEYGSAFAELRLRSGLQRPQRGLNVDLREAYVDAYFGDLDLRLGKQIVVWGRADAFNPTNNVTPVDLQVRSPVEDDRRIGNVGLRVNYNLRPLRFEGVWMPLFVPVEIPNVALPEYVRLTDPIYPDGDIADGIFAGRLHFLFDSFEGSVSYLHGYAPMPGLSLHSYIVGADPEVRIARTAYNHDVIGADFSTTVGSYGLRAEAAYRKPLHYEDRVYAPRPDVQFVAGVDRQFDDLSVIVQYAGRYVLDWQEDPPSSNANPRGLALFSSPVSPAQDDEIRGRAATELAYRNQVLFQQTAELQHMVSLRLEYLAMHETLSLSALGLVNVTTKEWLAYPKISYKFSDSMSGAVGGEIYVGPDESLLNLIEEELSAGYAELRFSF
jgi:hypothetical protein